MCCPLGLKEIAVVMLGQEESEVIHKQVLFGSIGAYDIESVLLSVKSETSNSCAWYCVASHGIKWHCMALRGIHGITRYCMTLQVYHTQAA